MENKNKLKIDPDSVSDVQQLKNQIIKQEFFLSFALLLTLTVGVKLALGKNNFV